MGHCLQKSPIISGSFAKRDLEPLLVEVLWLEDPFLSLSLFPSLSLSSLLSWNFQPEDPHPIVNERDRGREGER